MKCFMLYIAEINSPLGEGKYKLEGFHNGVHLWVGGAMKAVGTSPYDPVFYLHHAYIDYLWEKWRKIQEDCGNDPETDYVDDSVIPNPERQYQCYNCEMLTMEHYNISDGLSNRWTRFYFRYEDSPTCENDCGGSNLLYCNEMKNMCLPIRRIGSAALVKSFPLPGSGASAPDPILKLRANVQCDKFLDPNCNNLRANLLEEADEPLQPWDELQTIEQMVPINQGELFAAGERDSRSLWTMKEDIEEFDKELAMFRASRRLSVARRPPAAG